MNRPIQAGGSVPIYKPAKQKGGIIGYERDPIDFINRSPVPIYTPVRQRGGIIGYGHEMGIPRWTEPRGEMMQIPIYRPGRQAGGGGFLSGVKTRLIRIAEPLRDQAVERGVKAMKNVVSDALEGKDLKEALQDEKTRMHMDLKRKKDEVLHKTLGAGVKRKRKKLDKVVIDSLFS